MSEERKAEFRALYTSQLLVSVAALEDACGSEIERLFALAFLAIKSQPEVAADVPADLQVGTGGPRWTLPHPTVRARGQLYLSDPKKMPEEAKGAPHAVISHGTYSWLVPQVPVQAGGRRYVIDFALLPEVGSGLRPIAIELDGHDFHEKTKEQVRKDKERERALQAVGYTVIRFSGSEVWRDPFQCVRETLLLQHFQDVRAEMRP